MKKILGNRLSNSVFAIFCTIIFCAILNFFWRVPLNIHSTPFWWLMIVTAMFGYGMSTVCERIFRIINKVKEEREYLYGFDKIKYFFKQKNLSTYFTIISIILIVLLIITGVASSKAFNAKRYAAIIEIETGNFEDDVINVESSDIITVDVKTAQKLGDRTLGSLEKSSWYDVNQEYNLISINGEEYRISPIEYGDILKYLKAKSIPGYVLVNAKTQEAEIVRLEEGMKYSPTAAFKYDLSRHLHYQYPTYMFGKSFFEVDDEKNPYWITPVRTATIGLRSGLIENSVVITNAVSGESVEYENNNIPEWVDHVHSADYLMNRIEWYYKYSDGFLNSITSKTDVYNTAYSYKESKQSDDESQYTPFEGYNSLVSKNGEVLFYTGITPANSAETNIGFVLVSPRTGIAKFYEANGAEEYSAQVSAEGLVQNLRYSASFPTIINVDGVETYFMTLKDGAGLVKKYALCNVEQYSKCVEGDTIEETINKYKEKLGMKVADSSSDTSEIELIEKTGTISDVKQAEIDGYTYYYFTLEQNTEIVFMSSIENSNLQPFMMTAGTNVTIKYYNSQIEEGIGIVKEISLK